MKNIPLLILLFYLFPMLYVFFLIFSCFSLFSVNGLNNTSLNIQINYLTLSFNFILFSWKSIKINFLFFFLINLIFIFHALRIQWLHIYISFIAWIVLISFLILKISLVCYQDNTLLIMLSQF